MRTMWALLITALVASVANGAKSPELQNGDLIFHESKSRQSKAIQEATGSPISHVGIVFKHNSQWMVFEAVDKVRVSPIRAFVQRGVGGRFFIKRLKPHLVDLSVSSNQLKLAKAMQEMHGRPYDIFFEWTDNAIYCSELVWKGFMNAFGYSPGVVQRLRELDFSGPYAQALLQERASVKPDPVNWDEPIVTPATVFDSPDLDLVYSQNLQPN